MLVVLRCYGVMGALLAVLGGVGPARADAPPDAAEVRALLAYPETSVSLGRTNGGSLLHAARLPERGAGFERLSAVRGRKTEFGTRALVGAIERAAAEVARRYPGSVLAVGNLGFETGDTIPWSVSHQAGRDADLGMYATRRDGSLIRALPFVFFESNGLAHFRGEAVRFEPARNLALVAALVDDASLGVQYIFVAEWLKQALLEEATRQGLPPMLIGRLREVLHQPTDSNQHANHFHIRLQCSAVDRRLGCLDREPLRPWIDRGDAAFAAHVAALRGVITAERIAGIDPKGAKKLKIAVIERLGALESVEALPELVGLVGGPDRAVAEAALRAIAGVCDVRAAPLLLRALPGLTVARDAIQVFEVITKFVDVAALEAARQVLSDLGPGGAKTLLHPNAVRGAAAELVVLASQMFERHSVKSESHSHSDLARLMEIGSATRERRIQRAVLGAVQAWACRPLRDWRAATRWWQDMRGGDPLTWIERGFQQRGLQLPASEIGSREGIGRLIELLDHRDPVVRRCAARGLAALTGHDADPRWRSPRNNRRHWQSWWASEGGGE